VSRQVSVVWLSSDGVYAISREGADVSTKVKASLVVVAALFVVSCTPVVKPATQVTDTSAVLNGAGVCEGANCDTYFKYWRAVDIEDTALTTPVRNWTGLSPNTLIDAFPEQVTGLERGQAYLFRFCGKEAHEEEYHCTDTQSFRTRTGITIADVAGAGVDVSPYDVAVDDPNRVPSGQALVDTMEQQGVEIVRLTYVFDDDRVLATNGGWETVFSRLQAAGIDAVLGMFTLAGGADCNCGLNVQRAIIDDEQRLIAREKEVLDHIRQQHDGAFPPNLVGIDAMNEPATNHPPTMQKLPTIINAIKEYSDLPTFIGGWVGDQNTGRGAGTLCQGGSFVGDVYSPHIYKGDAGVIQASPSLDPSTPAVRVIGGNAMSVTSPPFSPPANGIIFAIVTANGPDAGTPQSVEAVTSTGTGLAWRLLGDTTSQPARSNVQAPGLLGGTAEVWWAFNANAQSNITVTAQLVVPSSALSPDGFLQTLVFNNADPHQEDADVTTVASITPQVPSATVRTTQTNAWVWAAVSNWSNETVGTPAGGQGISASSRNTTTHRAWWTQRTSAGTAPAQTNVTISDTGPSVRFNMVAFEVQWLPSRGADGPGQPARDGATSYIRGIGANQTAVTSPAFNAPAGSVIYATVMANGPDTGTPQSVTGVSNTGTSLNWQLLTNPISGTVARSNLQSPGVLGGTAEVWWAYNPTAQTSIMVTAQLAVRSVSSPDGFLEAVVVNNAAPDQTGAAIAKSSSAAPALPTTTFKAAVPGTLVWSAVSNGTNATTGTAGPGQSIWRTSRNQTTNKAWWIQQRTAPIAWTSAAGTDITTSATAPSVAYNMVTFEVRPGPIADPAVYAAATSTYLQNAATELAAAGCTDLPPMFVTEYGAKNGVVPSEGPGTPQHQQAVIGGTYDALKAKQTSHNITGALIWAIVGINQPYRMPPRVQRSAPFPMINYRVLDQTQCPGCTVIGPSTYAPAYFDLPSRTFP